MYFLSKNRSVRRECIRIKKQNFRHIVYPQKMIGTVYSTNVNGKIEEVKKEHVETSYYWSFGKSLKKRHMPIG